MTNEEAVKCLKAIESEYMREYSDTDISDVVSIDIDSVDIEALDMAMDALKGNDDCIVLTKDAYDYLVRNQNKDFTHVANFDDARPGDVIGVFTDKTHEEHTRTHASESEEHETHEERTDFESEKDSSTTNIGSSTDLTTDCISKKGVKKLVNNNYRKWFVNDKAFVEFVNELKSMPPIEPKRKPGEWIIVEENAEWFEGIKGTVIQCRDCHFIHTIPHNAKMYNFCPECGRRMKAQEGTT